MKVNWLLEEEMFWEGNPDVLSPAIRNQGMEAKFAKYIPFDVNEAPDYYGADECVVVYGSVGFVKKVCSTKEWHQCCFYGCSSFLCSTYYPRLSKFLLNKNFVFLPYGELVRQKDWLFEKFGSSNCIFVRPDSGGKAFTGHVAAYDDFEKSLENMSYGTVDPDAMAVVAEPKNIKKEYRFFLADGSVVSGCQYKVGTNHKEEEGFPDEAGKLAEEVAKNEWTPARMFVADICETSEGFHLVEVNCFNSAGLYACNAYKIVKKASEIAYDIWDHEMNGGIDFSKLKRVDHKFDLSKVRIVSADTDLVDKYRLQISNLLGLINQPGAFVTDESCLSDFGLTQRKVDDLKTKLDIDITEGDRLVDIAAKM